MSNVLKKIFIENWEGFKKRYPAYDTEYYNEVVEKMLNCGDMKYGYTEYRCGYCGEGQRIIPFSCKCMFCLRCGKVYADNFSDKVSEVLHPGVIYRHLILTIPEDLYVLFYKERQVPDLLNQFFKAGWDFIEDLMRTVLRKEVKTGCIMILHIAGRLGNYRPHLHILLIDGSIVKGIKKWIMLGRFPYKILHKKWQYRVLTMLRQYFNSKEVDHLIDKMWRKYPNGFVANIKKGKVPDSSSGLARYLAKYVSNPTISLKRIIDYDTDRLEVEYRYKSHKTKRMETERIDSFTFIGRLVQQILPKGFQRVRYYGLQATKTFQKVKDMIISAMSKAGKIVSGGYKVVKKVLYRQRYQNTFGKDPFKCDFCGRIMDVWKIWSFKYGIIFDEEKRIKSGVYGSVNEPFVEGDDFRQPSFEQLSFLGA